MEHLALAGGREGRKRRDLSAVLSSLADDPLVISTVSIQLLRAARADQGAPFLQLRAEEGRGHSVKSREDGWEAG